MNANHSASPNQPESNHDTDGPTPETKQPLCESNQLKTDHFALATCDSCRADGGCIHKFRSFSPVPQSGAEDPELLLGRTALYELMKQGADGMRPIEFYEIKGKRLMDGASKCRYLRSTKNNSTTSRGGDRRSKESTDAEPVKVVTSAEITGERSLSEPTPAAATPNNFVAEKSEEPPPIAADVVNQPPATDENVVLNQPKPAAEITPPPRHPGGQINWEQISDKDLAILLEKFLVPQLAESWRVARSTLDRQISKRKARAESVGSAEMPTGAAGTELGASVFTSRRTSRYDKPSKLKFFELVWTMPCTHIAEKIGCSQATVLGWAKAWDFEGPGPGFWQRKNNGITVEAPAHISVFYLSLRAAAPPEEVLGEVPEVFRSKPILIPEPAIVQPPADSSGSGPTPTLP